MLKMCSKFDDNIILFDVSGVPIKIMGQKLAKHPESSLTTMVHDKVQPHNGWFVECCHKIFGYILRFIVDDIRLDPLMVANKIGTTEAHVRKIVDSFKLKGIYVKSCGDSNFVLMHELFLQGWNHQITGNIELAVKCYQEAINNGDKCAIFHWNCMDRIPTGK